VIRSLTVTLALAWLGQAGATAFYAQPAAWAGTGTQVGSGSTSQTDTSLTGFRTLDNFTLTTAAEINQATWFGIYLNPDLTDASPNTDSWIVRFQADNAGVPGSVLLTTTQPAAQVIRQTAGTGLFGNNTVTVYEFTITFPTALHASANTPYWFSPLSRASNFLPFFSWIEGTGGDDLSFQTIFSAGMVTDTAVPAGDRAFSLAFVPEPATVTLVGVALAAALARRRRSI
jgi:hypothetical protein